MRREMVKADDLDQRFGIELKKRDVVETRYRKGVPREFSKKHPTVEAARAAFEKRVRVKLNDGFVHVVPMEQVAVGGVRFECSSKGGGGGGLLDLSKDGRFVVAAEVEHEARGCRLTVFDTFTGAGRVVFERTSPEQTFLHAALFDATAESLIVQLNCETLRVDLATGKTRSLAEYREFASSRFNPFVVQPVMDAARRRVVLFDAGNVVRVLELEGERVVREFPTTSATTECRGVALSPSGKKLALYRPSRGVVYGHDDAGHDTSSVVEVYDVDSGALVVKHDLGKKLGQLGFTPEEDALLVTWDYAQGPVAYRLPDFVELWRFEDAFRTDRLATAYTWAWSVRGKSRLLALAGNTVQLHDATKRETLPVALPLLEQLERYRVQRLQVSADGAWLAVWAQGVTSVFRLR